VIPVYGKSIHFQGYVAQGRPAYERPEHQHYLFLADDCVLNPVINEGNCGEHFHLSQDACFLPELISLPERREYWLGVREAFEYRFQKQGVEVRSLIPSVAEAAARLERFGVTVEGLQFDQIYAPQALSTDVILSRRRLGDYVRWRIRRAKSRILRRRYHGAYPLVGGYSDIFVIAKSAIRTFAHFCGIFAATDLFAELAIPTALCLSAESIVTEASLALRGRALWTREDYAELNVFDSSLTRLLSGFPPRYLYLHPIKLSQWRD
jgi:hypothetical protein